MQLFPNNEEERKLAVVFGGCPGVFRPTPTEAVTHRTRRAHLLEQQAEILVGYTASTDTCVIISSRPAFFPEQPGIVNFACEEATAHLEARARAEQRVASGVKDSSFEQPEDEEVIEFRSLPRPIETILGFDRRVRLSVSAAEFVRRERGRQLKIERNVEEEPE